MARLVFRDQHGRERSVDIGAHRTRVTIGRNADCIIQTNNASVSREHSVVLFRDGRFLVQDPPPGPPTNGTYINGTRLRPGEIGQLGDKDELKCGNFEIQFYQDEPQHAGPPQHGGPPRHGAPGEPPLMHPPAQAAPSQQWGPPPVADPAQMSELHRENVSLKAVEQRQREQIEQHQHDLLDKERLIADLERRSDHHNNVLEGLNDKIAKLKEQVELQKEQLRTYRDELKNRNDEIEDLSFKLGEIQRAMSSAGAGAASAEGAIADLKVQINQRDRRIDDLQRELDLAQYAVTTERDNVERLEMTLGQVNNQTEGFERYRADMQKVVEQHEASMGDLQRALEGRDREIESLVDQLRHAERAAAGGGDVSSLQAELRAKDDEIAILDEQLRQAEKNAGRSSGGGAEVSSLKALVADLEAELEAAQESGGGGGRARDLQRALNELKRENRDLKMALQEGGGAPSGGGGDGDPELRRRIHELEGELDDTRKRMREVQRSSSGGGGGAAAGLKERAKDVYQVINDVVSQWRDDMRTLEDYITELQRLIESVQRIDLSRLATVDRVRLEGLIEEIDPKLTFEELSALIENQQSAAGSVKASLRDLREVVT